MSFRHGNLPGSLDKARAIACPERRRFLRHTLGIGALAFLGGCKLEDDAQVTQWLTQISRWNDLVQARLFDPARLAPTFPDSRMTRPFPFNAYYDPSQVPVIDPATYRLQLGGRIARPTPWSLAAIRRLPYIAETTRLVCVEGWSAIGRWGGVPLGTFLKVVGADLNAKYVAFRCADDYYTSIDMPTALHPQTLLAHAFAGQPLPREYGFPLRVRIPTKLGFKNPKHVVALSVTNTYPGGYWEDQGYNWFSGL